MRVSKELFSNDMGRVTGNDLAIEGRPVVDAVDLRQRNVTNDSNTLTNILSGLELLNEPLDFAMRVILIVMTVQVKVHGVVKVGVERDDVKAGCRVESVGSIVLERLDGITR